MIPVLEECKINIDLEKRGNKRNIYIRKYSELIAYLKPISKLLLMTDGILYFDVKYIYS